MVARAGLQQYELRHVVGITGVPGAKKYRAWARRGILEAKIRGYIARMVPSTTRTRSPCLQAGACSCVRRCVVPSSKRTVVSYVVELGDSDEQF